MKGVSEPGQVTGWAFTGHYGAAERAVNKSITAALKKPCVGPARPGGGEVRVWECYFILSYHLGHVRAERPFGPGGSGLGRKASSLIQHHLALCGL